MRRVVIVPVLMLFASVLMPLSAAAQVRPAVFEDYTTFEEFVFEKVSKRQFGALFQRMAGGDKLSLSDVQKITEQAKKGFPNDFEDGAILRREELENGFSHEARAFWTGESYAFAYVLMHQRDDGLVIVNFGLHAAPAQVMTMF